MVINFNPTVDLYSTARRGGSHLHHNRGKRDADTANNWHTGQEKLHGIAAKSHR